MNKNTMSSLALLALSCSAWGADSSDCNLADAREEENLERRLVELNGVSECLKTRQATLRQQMKSAQGEELAAMMQQAEGIAADAATAAVVEEEKIQTKNKLDFTNYGFGVGVGFSWGRGDGRVDEAEVVNGVVRVKRDSTDKARLFLEAHKFFWTFSNDSWGTGPFVSVQSGSDDVLSSWGAGWMLGFRDTPAKNAEADGWNIGVGYLWDSDVQVLADGVQANEPLPEGETGIRYKRDSKGSVFALFSRRF